MVDIDCVMKNKFLCDHALRYNAKTSYLSKIKILDVTYHKCFQQDLEAYATPSFFCFVFATSC